MKENWIEMQKEMRVGEESWKIKRWKKKRQKKEDSERMEEGVEGAGRRQIEEENKERNVEEIEKDRKKYGVDREERKNVLVKSREGRREKDCRV